MDEAVEAAEAALDCWYGNRDWIDVIGLHDARERMTAALSAADAARAVGDEDDARIAAAVFGIAVADMGKQIREGLQEAGLKVVRG